MKKLITKLLLSACLLLLAACESKKQTDYAASVSQDGKDNKDLSGQELSDPMSYAFEAQYIRTNGYSEDRSYPCHVIIDSREELEAYYEENKEVFDLERKETVYSDTTIGFLDACDKYDDTYFERQNLVLIVLEEGSGSVRHKITDVRPHSNQSYFVPDYHSTNRLHSDEFLENLKRDGYYRDGEMDHNYNTDNITDIVNITPESIFDERPDVEVFYLSEQHCFLMVNHTIYRYDTFGGYHQQLCLWDYDRNGTKDLVSYYTCGSGLSYLGVSILDLTSMENIEVITRMILSEPTFSFECKNGVIYIDGVELTYSDGNFHCDSFDNAAQ